MHRLHKVLHIPDTHTPYHDKTAYKLMLDVAQAFKPDEVVYLGDFFDAYSISSHDKNPLKDPRVLKDELIEGRDLLSETEKICKAKKYTFMQGNHEFRIERYIAAGCPKLSGLYSSREILCIPGDYGYFPYGQENYYRIGKLTITHGYLAGENPAATTVKKFRSSVILGHVHKLQEYHITNIHGEDWVGICAGWLGNPRKAAEYMKGVTDWSLGFVLTWHKPDGSFFYQLIQIKKSRQNYECLFNSEVFVRWACGPKPQALEITAPILRRCRYKLYNR